MFMDTVADLLLVLTARPTGRGKDRTRVLSGPHPMMLHLRAAPPHKSCMPVTNSWHTSISAHCCDTCNDGMPAVRKNHQLQVVPSYTQCVNCIKHILAQVALSEGPEQPDYCSLLFGGVANRCNTQTVY